MINQHDNILVYKPAKLDKHQKGTYENCSNSNSVIFLKPEIDRAKLHSDETKSVFHDINSGETSCSSTALEDSTSQTKKGKKMRHDRKSDFADDIDDKPDSMVTD